MAKLDYEKLSDEIYQNVLDDRQRMGKIAQDLLSLSSSDPLASLGASELMARLQDCMTKSNAQLIELLRLSKKGSPDKDRSDDRENLLDEIASARADA